MPVAADFMQRLAKTRHNPSAFSELVFGTPLHAGQRRYAENAVADVNFLLPGNSWGKTDEIVRLAMHKAWHKEGTNYLNFEEWLTAKDESLVASYNYSVAKESFDRLVTFIGNREELQGLVAKVSNTDPVSIHLTNGSVIFWGSLDSKGKLVEAKRLKRIFVDEVGHIPDLSYTFDNVLFPRTMGVGGKIHLFGTPKEYSDPYLLEIYDKGKNDPSGFYYSQDGCVFENEYWPDSEKVRVLRNPRYVRGWVPCPLPSDCHEPICRDGQHPLLTNVGKQVLLGFFVLSGGYFFNRFHIGTLFEWPADYPEPTWVGEDHFFIPPERGHFYHGSWDLGGNKLKSRKSNGSDPTVGFVIDYTTRPWKVVYFNYVRGGEADWEQKYNEIAKVHTAYKLPYTLIDATGQVDSVQEALENRGVMVEGVQFGGNSGKKLDMLRNLQLCMEMEWDGVRGVLRSPPIPQLRHELERYVFPDDNIRQDCVMSFAMDVHHIAMSEVPAASYGEQF